MAWICIARQSFGFSWYTLTALVMQDIIAHGVISLKSQPVPGPRSAASQSPLSRPCAAATATLTSSLA